MTTQALMVPDHLHKHRRTIFLRSLAAGLAGLIPIPLLDDWAAGTILTGTLRGIAEARGVDIDEAALRQLVHGDPSPPGWRTLIGTTAVFAKKRLRQVLVALSLANRADTVARWYAIGTLFDHYCTRLHIGAGIDVARARQIRAAAVAAASSSRFRVLGQAIGRSLAAAAKAAVRAPFEVVDLLSGGLLRKKLLRGGEPRAVDLGDAEVTEAAPKENTFFGKTVRSIETQFGLFGDTHARELVAAFEAGLAKGPPTKA